MPARGRSFAINRKVASCQGRHPEQGKVADDKACGLESGWSLMTGQEPLGVLPSCCAAVDRINQLQILTPVRANQKLAGCLRESQREQRMGGAGGGEGG